MKQTIVSPSGVPTANLAINKSRIKLYNKTGSMPTYYLEKGQEFQIELFNPTSDTVLAKIHLNGKAITQGGLVVKPGQRVFLERYIDVAKKFLFDTYDVNNTAEVRKAIEDNGDFKVQFYRESQPTYFCGGSFGGYNQFNGNLGNYHTGTPQHFLRSSGTISGGMNNTTYTTNSVNSSSRGFAGASASYSDGTTSMDFLSMDNSLKDAEQLKRSVLRAKSSKSIETGRVEMGAASSQKLQYVDTKFDSYAFHTVEYKMLPLSQKVNTSEDLNVKRYCSNCGAKHKPSNKFCPSCGTKA